MTLLERTQKEIDADIVRIQNYIDELTTALDYLPPSEVEATEKQIYFSQRKKDEYARELPDSTNF